ncbi:ArsC family reductase [Vibrio aphrogenes]|uniref:ArsC family reductase n=1 Tax=Vibrio aphrogenes TaxID=1891186 RepID=UPI000B356373|nr:ArsC family reductase [Vibrio aphrogenes]
MLTMYGIPNCDTIKKAKKWLESEGIDYQFHNYRKDGITPELVTAFCQTFGWDKVVNKRSTTYRQLTEEQKNQLDEHAAIALLVEHPAMIKRPILLSESVALIGFKAAEYDEKLK